MSNRNLINTAQVESISLLGSHIEVTEIGPTEETETTVTVNTTETDLLIDSNTSDGTTRLMVTASLHGNPNKDNSYMSARIDVVVRTSSGLSGNTVKELEHMHRTEAINAGYSFARAHLMSLTGISPMGQFVLPTIDISSLI